MCMCVCVYLPNSTTNLFSSGPTGCYTFVNFFESSFFCSGNVTATARAGGRQCFFFYFFTYTENYKLSLLGRVSTAAKYLSGVLPTAPPLSSLRLLQICCATFMYVFATKCWLCSTMQLTYGKRIGAYVLPTFFLISTWLGWLPYCRNVT